MVVFGHHWPIYFGQWNWNGHYAVFSFYVISGYLMSLVLNERYWLMPRGIWRYFLNRALRIYPPYWVAVLCSILLLLLVPDAVKSINLHVSMPDPWDQWLKNITILGLKPGIGTIRFRLVPITWSLHVELCFYIMMAFGLARSRYTAIPWFLASVAYTAWIVYHDWSFPLRYGPLPAASLAFSTGCMLYFLRLNRKLPAWPSVVVGLLFVGGSLGGATLWGDVHGSGFYVQFFLGACLVYLLSHVDGKALPKALAGADRLLGDLSYPVFLFHFHVGTLIVFAAGIGGWDVGPGGRPHSYVMLPLSLTFSTIAAYLVHRAVEVPVEKIRSIVRD